MTLAIVSVVTALTRVVANWLVSKHRVSGWWCKLPTIAAFTWLNYKAGYVGLHLLGALDLLVTINAIRDWSRKPAPVLPLHLRRV